MFSLARLCIAIHSWGMSSESGSEGIPEGLSLVLWREGLLAMHNFGYILVESFYDRVSNNACFGIPYFLMVSNITVFT